VNRREWGDGSVYIGVGRDRVARVELAEVSVKLTLTKQGVDAHTRGNVGAGGGYPLAVELLGLIHELGYLTDVTEDALGPDLMPLNVGST
jgi:hypothetical protein